MPFYSCFKYTWNIYIIGHDCSLYKCIYPYLAGCTDRDVETIDFQGIGSGVRTGLPAVFPLTRCMTLDQLFSHFGSYDLTCKLKVKPFHRVVERILWGNVFEEVSKYIVHSMYLLLWLFIVIIDVIIADVVILPHFSTISPLFRNSRGIELTLYIKY